MDRHAIEFLRFSYLTKLRTSHSTTRNRNTLALHRHDTGISGQRVEFANGYITDAAADARAVVGLIPTARTVINVGAEEGRAIKVNSRGKVLDFAINDKCAAGTGTFLEAMARALEIPVEEMAKISLDSTTAIPMNAQCAVFGESEVVSLIHQKTPK